MKIKNFLSLIIMVIAVILIIGLTFCRREEPCEENNIGWVTIHNNLGKTITVDVYSEQLTGIRNCFLGPQQVLDGSTVTYNEVPAGIIQIWADDLSSGWDYWEVDNQNRPLYVTNCETLEFETY
jgi:hypothetical protein